MELLVCIKQVPDDSVTVTLDPATGGPQLKDITPVVNAFDTYALEMATRFKEANGGSVTVVTIGDEAALTPSLRSCLSVGAEHAYVAVSYTHLDVYKRQAQYTPKFWFSDGQADWDVLNLKNTELDREKTEK